jgi:hypothetical protein
MASECTNSVLLVGEHSGDLCSQWLVMFVKFPKYLMTNTYRYRQIMRLRLSYGASQTLS